MLAGQPIKHAAIAQLGEHQTEDLKVPSSILGLGKQPGLGLGARRMLATLTVR